MTIITPTVGRIVWYTPVSPNEHVADHGGQPFAAIVTYVWNDRMINITAFDHNGTAWSHTSVVLAQEGDPKPEQHYAEWMPYQLGQAKKHEVQG